jgi:hypothetical protein
MLFAAQRKLGIDDAAWRALLERTAAVASSTELDQAGFDVLIRELERLGFKNTARDKPFGARPGFATPPQVVLINRLAAELWGDEHSDQSLRTWLRRFHHVDHARFVAFVRARGVIEGLKAQLARHAAPEADLPPPAA